uniref:GNAT family N-acetyltransferase n=1 Tax=Parerythrobacter lutipelagi TaxID=1964208 RepID=UPI0010F5DDE2|nr:GNAT family N-acetyltransferase [Parerythrobacter lutipelagi]
MADVTITHHPRGEGGRYLAQVAGSEHTGRLDWEPRGENVRVATHTVVPQAIGGQGIAAQLVDALIADAREEGFRIVPQCSYVEKKFEENPGWADLRA